MTVSSMARPKCALGEGLSENPRGQMRGLPAFMGMLDRLHSSNVSTLQMVVYDSGDGYDPDELWCGLAGSNYSKPLTNIGSEADWHTFIDAAHSRNMTVRDPTTWTTLRKDGPNHLGFVCLSGHQLLERGLLLDRVAGFQAGRG